MAAMADPTPPQDGKREKGPTTALFDKLETRDARQDERTDKAWQAALEAAQAGQASAERTAKLLWWTVGGCILAIVVLTAMVLDAKLNVTKDGVQVGDAVEAAP
jgi:type VI protein secretion system component VasF